MPHPERAMYWWQLPSWTRQKPNVSVWRWQVDFPEHHRQADQDLLANTFADLIGNGLGVLLF